MAHLGKPSLLSRLFPQEEQPADHFPSSEDWTSSTLLGRTSTPGRLSAPFTSSSSRDEQIHRLNDLFRTSFASLSSDAVPGTTHKDETVGGDVLAKLREAFVQEGVQLHSCVVENLAQAQREIESHIFDFASLTSDIASAIDDLYLNLSYPLSSTICHSKNFPRGTIETHLSDVKERLKKAEAELRHLENEWQENIRLEERLRQELLSMERGSDQNGEPGHDDAGYSRTEDLKEDVERIVADYTQALDEVEEGFKEEMQAETMKMMQAMWTS